MNVVITGASRGIGFGFVQHYLNVGAKVWACCRTGNKQLSKLGTPNLRLVQWDITENKSADFLQANQFPKSIDILINNAGVYGPDKAGGQSLEKITPETMMTLFDINCIGALRVVQLLKDSVISAQGKIANISSKMGSTEDNTSGGCYAYRASKSALIIVSKSMAIDLATYGVRVITLHPGWVKTDMTGHSGLIDIKESVAGMSRVIENIDQYCPGAFVAYDGQSIST